MTDEITNKRMIEEQKRAEKAWELVKIVKDMHNKDLADNYKTYVNSASTLIKTNGLLQTLAFWNSKKTKAKAYDLLLKHLSELVFNNIADKIINKATIADVDSYRALTNKSLACLLWMKRFAEAELGD